LSNYARRGRRRSPVQRRRTSSCRRLPSCRRGASGSSAARGRGRGNREPLTRFDMVLVADLVSCDQLCHRDPELSGDARQRVTLLDDVDIGWRRRRGGGRRGRGGWC
jgi:hypothetical protein